MGIFIKKEKRSLQQQADNVSMTVLSNFGNNYVSANKLENSDIWSAINIIASDIASLDLHYYLSNVRQEQDDFSYLFNVKPNQYYNGYSLKFILIANILLNGESFVELVRDREGNIVGLYHVKNSQITYKQDKSTNYNLVYEIDTSNYQKRRVSSDDILHLKFFSTDGIKGISPLISLKEDLKTQQYSKKFLTNFFRNGTQNGGVLKVKGAKLSEEAKNNLKNEWQKANSGTSEAHKVVVLDETMEYEAIEVDTEVLKLINTSNFSTEQVAKVFKVPRHRLGLESSNVSLEQANNSYIINTLNPYLKSITNEINFKTTCHNRRNERYQFDVDAFKFVDIETKTKTIKDKLSMGIINLNEARKEFGYEEIDNEVFTEHYINLNHVPLSMLKEYQLSKLKHAPISLKGGDNDE